MKPTFQSLPKGMALKQMGVFVAPNSAAALPMTIAADWLYIEAFNVNTDIVYMGLTSTVSSATGFAFRSMTSLWIPIEVGSSSLYFQSQGGSGVVSYIALGNGY